MIAFLKKPKVGSSLEKAINKMGKFFIGLNSHLSD